MQVTHASFTSGRHSSLEGRTLACTPHIAHITLHMHKRTLPMALLQAPPLSPTISPLPHPQEKRQFNEKFVRVGTKRLCELTSGADALKMRQVVDLASRQLARMIEGKSPDEIRAAFNLPDDLTEEEKLEPIRNVGEDARIRLLNRLYAKKRQVRGGPREAGAAVWGGVCKWH